jgi:glucose-1-phosphate thymidylyltransferase
MNRKGIVLAGGLATRLWPVTQVVSKQLMPVYDKPMIFYPLSVLMLAGIRDILIISTPQDLPMFKALLGTGSDLGINLTYVEQKTPNGLAQAFILGEEFICGSPCALILGDNIFFGEKLRDLLASADRRENGATVFTYQVSDPERYGVAEFDDNDLIISLEEKPATPRSNHAVTGLYFYDETVCERAKMIQPSSRNEYEITDLNLSYLASSSLYLEKMGRGFSWLDTGTHDALLEASQFVRTQENRQGLKIAALEEISFAQGWITVEQLEKRANKFAKTGYGQYLKTLTRT